LIIKRYLFQCEVGCCWSFNSSGEQAVGGCGKKNFCVSPRTTKHRAAAASNNDEHPNSIAQQQENT
jgi:hypothetical protein